MPIAELSGAISLKANTNLDWLSFGVPDNFNWDAILAAFFVSVGKNSLISVRHL